jgi:hypothetical protein
MDSKALFDEVVDDLLHRYGDAERAQMMGMQSVKRNGKLVVGYWPADDGMVFKLPNADERERALALDGAHLFDPGGRGRPFKEWVVVPPAHAAQWPDLAEQAITSPAG